MGLIKNVAFKITPSSKVSDLILRGSVSKSFFGYYHIVSDTPVPHTDFIIPRITTERFISDLDQLFSVFEPLHLNDVLSGKSISKPSLLITFDDGYREMHDVVAPILKAKGIPAVFFVNSAFVDNKAMLYRHKASILVSALADSRKAISTLNNFKDLTGTDPGTIEAVKTTLLSLSRYDDDVFSIWGKAAEIDFEAYLKECSPFMTGAQMRALSNQGFSFGGHSVSHFGYETLNLDEQVSETLKSIDFIQAALNLPYRVFAFPFSDKPVGKAFFDRVFDVNNSSKADFLFGNSGIKNDYHSNMLQRFSLERLHQSPLRTVQGEILYSLATGRKFKRH